MRTSMDDNGRRETAQSGRPPHWQGEAATLLFSAGTECENERENRARAGLTIKDSLPLPPLDYSSSVNPTRKVT
jgi:hypothetical protein